MSMLSICAAINLADGPEWSPLLISPFIRKGVFQESSDIDTRDLARQTRMSKLSRNCYLIWRNGAVHVASFSGIIFDEKCPISTSQQIW